MTTLTADTAMNVEIPCDEPECVRAIHLVDKSLYDIGEGWYEHVAETWNSSTPAPEEYEIHVYRDYDDSLWRVDVDASQYFASVEALSTLIEDLKHARAACVRLNEKRAQA